MIIDNEEKLDFSDVLIVPKRSTLTSRKDVDISREFHFINSDYKWKGIPIVASNMDTIGTMKMADALLQYGMCTALHKHYSRDKIDEYLNFINVNSHNKDNIFYTMGIRSQDTEKYYSLKNKPQMVCIDVANGYTKKFLEFVKAFRDFNPDVVLMAGNVVTGEMTESLILAGVDIVKIGIGNGSACQTRLVAGVGYPQLSAIMECADAAHGLGGHICSDGGCTVPGDIAKAFCAGADFVILGGMLAGHKECELEPIVKDGKTHYGFYGMSSATAMNKYNNGVDSHRASEGKTVLIEDKGDIADTVQYILGGVRSCMTYVGAKKLKEMSKRAKFIKVRHQYNTIFNGKEI